MEQMVAVETLVVDVPSIVQLEFQQFILYETLKFLRFISSSDCVNIQLCRRDGRSQWKLCRKSTSFTGAVRVATCCRQECLRLFVCATKESGDNGLIKSAEDGKEQFLDAIEDGQRCSRQVVDVPLMMQRRPGVLRSAHPVRWVRLSGFCHISRVSPDFLEPSMANSCWLSRARGCWSRRELDSRVTRHSVCTVRLHCSGNTLDVECSRPKQQHERRTTNNKQQPQPQPQQPRQPRGLGISSQSCPDFSGRLGW